MRQHTATFIALAEDAAGADLPQIVKAEFDAFPECGLLAHGFLRLRCGDCGHHRSVAFSCKRRGFCPSCGARRMAQTATHLVNHDIPHVPVREWARSLLIPLRLLLAAQPKLVKPVLQVVHRVITRHLLGQAGLKAAEADSGAVTLVLRLGSVANLNIHMHCLALDGVYRRGADGVPEFVEVPAPTDEALQTVLHKIITRLLKLLTRRGELVDAQGATSMADYDGDLDEARMLRPLQAAACNYRMAFGPRAGQKVLLKLKTAWRDGTTQLVISPRDFMQRLAALLPRPRPHLLRFLAPNAKLRALVVPQEADAPAQAAPPAECEANCAHHRPARLSWAKLLKRVFDLDLEHCPNRGGELKVIAAILAQPVKVIEKALTHLGLQARAPPRALARGQALQAA